MIPRRCLRFESGDHGRILIFVGQSPTRCETTTSPPVTPKNHPTVIDSGDPSSRSVGIHWPRIDWAAPWTTTNAPPPRITPTSSANQTVCVIPRCFTSGRFWSMSGSMQNPEVNTAPTTTSGSVVMSAVSTSKMTGE